MSSVPLKTVLLRHVEVIALILGHLDIPGSGGSGSSVKVKVEGVALLRSGNPHMLASILTTDDRRNSSPRVSNGQGVGGAVSHQQTPFPNISSWPTTVIGHWIRYRHGLIIYPELANVRA